MTILSFDLSLSQTGISVFNDNGEYIESLSIDTKKEKTHPLKLKLIEKEMTKLRKLYKPKLIVIEESFTRFNKSTHAIYKVRGVTELIFWNVEQVFIHATKVRKIFAGHGNMKKEQVLNYVIENYPHLKFKNLDEMDSFVLGMAHFIQDGVL